MRNFSSAVLVPWVRKLINGFVPPAVESATKIRLPIPVSACNSEDRFVLVSVSFIIGVVLLMCNTSSGLVVPIPTLPLLSTQSAA